MTFEKKRDSAQGVKQEKDLNIELRPCPTLCIKYSQCVILNVLDARECRVRVWIKRVCNIKTTLTVTTTGCCTDPMARCVSQL